MATNRYSSYMIKGHPATAGYLPKQASWTSYPEWAYQGYYRANPWVDESLPQNGGPYTPDIFPFGQGGRPKVWSDTAAANPHPGSIQKTPSELRKGDVIVASKGGSKKYNLWKVRGVRSTSTKTVVALQLLGMWSPGWTQYSEAPRSEETEYEFSSLQARHTPLSLLSGRITPMTLNEPRKGKRGGKFARKNVGARAKPAAPWVSMTRVAGGERYRGHKLKSEAARADEIYKGTDIRIRGRALAVGQTITVPWSKDVDVTFLREDPQGRSAFANARGRGTPALKHLGTARLVKMGTAPAIAELKRRGRTAKGIKSRKAKENTGKRGMSFSHHREMTSPKAERELMAREPDLDTIPKSPSFFRKADEPEPPQPRPTRPGGPGKKRAHSKLSLAELREMARQARRNY